MKQLATAIGVLVLATVTMAGAQQPASPSDAHHPAGQAPAPGRQPHHQGGGAMPMMDMCREMMGGGHGMMGRGMMGGMGPGMMAGGQPGDPRTMAQMMEMRGEMMKAMGEIMLKHAKRLQEAPPSN